MLLFKDDLRDDFRLSERSAKVVRYWGSPQEAYEHESGSAKECDAYLKLTAERVMFRVKVLGLPEPDAFLTDRELLDASFIDGRTPKLSELLDPNVRIAMAYVPLTPVGNVGNPVLARLYCAKGLQGRYFPSHLLEDGLLPGMEGFSWFFAGLPDEKFDRKIDGRSWLLAASLLMFALQKGDATVVRNLAMKFIVTGDVTGNKVGEVQMYRKYELANGIFRKLKWIVPNQNAAEVHMLNADIPETLAEAQKLIVTDRNHATDSLLAAVAAETLNSRIIASQLAIGADVSVCDPVRHENMTQILRRRLVERVVDAISEEGTVASRVEKILDEYFDATRILSYYADLPQIFFTLARRRDDAAIESMLMRYGADAINTTDVKGETALDFAIKHDPASASVLRQHGAKPGIYQVCSDYMREMLRAGANGFSAEIAEYFLSAAKSGNLDLNALVDFGDESLSCTANFEYDTLRGGRNSSICVASTVCTRSKTNVFLEAILNDETGCIVKTCIDNGVNVNMLIDFRRDAKDMDVGDDFDFAPDISIVKGDFPICTPLELAALAKHKGVAKFLANAGAKTAAQLKIMI